MVIGIIVDVMSRDARENLFDNIDANAYDITVTFEVINAPGEIVQLDVLLEALR